MLELHPSYDLNLHLSRVPLPAAEPPEQRGLARDAVQLLVLNRRTGQLADTRFSHLPSFLDHGDLLVVNNSATIPGRLEARAYGQRLCLHLATKLSDYEYIVERRTEHGGPDRRPFTAGDLIEVVHPHSQANLAMLRVQHRFHPNSRLWCVVSDANLFQVAHDFGTPIRYHYLKEGVDPDAYDTIFARIPGSAEMPSASRPFTHRTLRALAASGVQVCSLVLHTGVSSHEVETDLAHHPVLPEWYRIPESTAAIVNRAKRKGRRIIAVGTTVVRALESAADEKGCIHSGSRWTTHLVTPAAPPRIVTSLLTGMHESQTSHLALMYAFVPPGQLRAVYEHALSHGYLWHEFGDMNLIL